MAIRCDKCGIEAPEARLFRAYYPSVSDPPLHYCPSCWAKREKRTQRHEVYAVGGMLAVLVLGGLLAPGEGGSIARLGATLLLIYFAAVVLHELGHAVAAWLLGMRVFKISVGLGPTVFKRRFGHTDIELHAIPTCGFVHPGDRSLTLARTRQFLVTLAGPATNAGLAFLGFAALGQGWIQGLGSIADVSFFHLLFGVNAIIAVTNLIPFVYPAAGDDLGPAVQPNDGMLMLMMLFVGGAAAQHWLAAAVSYEASDAAARGDYASALAVTERGIAKYPKVPALRMVHARVLRRSGRPEAAITELRHVLEDDRVGDDLHCAAMAELAEAHLERGSEADLAEADRLSRLAIDRMPEPAEVRAVRGRVLVATGWVAKGYEMLKGVLAESGDDETRARIACHIARAELAQGDKAQARRYLDLARSLHPDSPSIAETAMASEGQRTEGSEG